MRTWLRRAQAVALLETWPALPEARQRAVAAEFAATAGIVGWFDWFFSEKVGRELSSAERVASLELLRMAIDETLREQPSAGEAADQLAASTGPKVGRNDPCWCGSGVKFKKCHGGRGR